MEDILNSTQANHLLPTNCSIDGNSGSFELPVEITIISAVVYVFFVLFGVIGNLIICIVIAVRKPMHTSINYYLFNLAISDLAILLVTILLHNETFWDINSMTLTSEVIWWAKEVAYEASALTVTALSIERCIAICYPLKMKTMSNSRVTWVSLTVIWIFSIMTSFSFVYAIKGNLDLYKILMPLHCGLLFGVPVLVIFCLYITICIQLMKRNIATTNTGDKRAIKLAGKLVPIIETV